MTRQAAHALLQHNPLNGRMADFIQTDLRDPAATAGTDIHQRITASPFDRWVKTPLHHMSKSPYHRIMSAADRVTRAVALLPDGIRDDVTFP